jgi:hypothetical protein
MTYRWMSSEEIETFVNPVCEQRGWSPLNINEAQPTCRVIGAFDGEAIVGFFALQLHPVLGPQWVDADHRDGTISRELTQQMSEFLSDVDARGWLVICDSPVSERLAIRYGMKKLEIPVYVGMGG